MGNTTSSAAELSIYISQLKDEAIDDTKENDKFWKQIIFQQSTPEIVFAAITPAVVREILEKQPENYKTMVKKCLLYIETFISKNGIAPEHETILNCLRLLTRLIPFAFETGSTLNDEFFWKIPEIKKEQEEAEGDTTKVEDTETSNNKSNTASIGQRIIHATMRLCFVSNFTVARERAERSKKMIAEAIAADETFQEQLVLNDDLIWASGVGTTGDPVDINARLDRNRIETLKLLVSCFSNILYCEPHKYVPGKDPWLLTATNRKCPNAMTLFHSLINVSVGYDPVGLGIPYTGNILEDPRDELSTISLHVFLALVDFAAPPPPKNMAEGTANHPSMEKTDLGNGTGSNNNNDETNANALEANNALKKNNQQAINVENIHRSFVFSLDGTKNFQFLFGGITRLLNNHHECVSAFFGGATKQIEFHQELLVLFWKLADGNSKFCLFCLQQADINEMVLPCLYFMWIGRNRPSMAGLVHLCTFILLLLSGERNFGVSLNKPYANVLPLNDLTTFTGTSADLLIIVCHKLVVNGHRTLDSLYNCFLTIISNISPYIKSMSLPTCLKLLNLFEIFSSKRYLLAQDSNHQYVFFLMDIFNNIIQYQYAGNAHLIYAIIRRKSSFDRLFNLKLNEENEENENATTTDNNNNNNELKKAETTAVKTDDEEKTGGIDLPKKEEEKVVEQSGPPKFVPTTDWLVTWKSRLPIGTVLRLLQHLVPQVENLCRRNAGSVDEDLVLQFLRKTTMVGLLPVPHAIIVRRYQPNKFTNIWFSTYLWGVIFLRNQRMPLFDGTKISLFHVHVGR